jgi:hypothetical protein
LLLEEQRFGDDGSSTTRTEQFAKGGNQMNEQDG